MTAIKYRYQNDDTDWDKVSDDSGTYTPPDAVGARQEFKDECDINFILARAGVLSLTNKMPVNGAVIDYNVDLMRAYEMADEVQVAWQRLDPGLRQKYPTWVDLIWAMKRGDVVMDQGALAEKKSDSNIPTASLDILTPTTT